MDMTVPLWHGSGWWWIMREQCFISWAYATVSLYSQFVCSCVSFPAMYFGKCYSSFGKHTAIVNFRNSNFDGLTDTSTCDPNLTFTVIAALKLYRQS